MPQIARLSGTSNVDDVYAALTADGGVVIEDFLSHDVLQALQRDLLPALEGQATGRDHFSGDRTRRLSALFSRTPHVQHIATHPLFLNVAERILRAPVKFWNDGVRLEIAPDLRIGVAQAIQIGPGQTRQTLHRDDVVFLWRHPDYGREARVQIMVAITDFTADNGGTLVIPGSHKWDDERAPRIEEAVPTVMRAGSAVLWLGSLYHAGGANITTSEYRTGLTLALDMATLRQEENMYLSLPKEVVAQYSEQVQRLLGWSAAATNMGWVEIDGQMCDPILLLKEAGSTVVGVAGGPMKR